jgi:RecA-family ATPase
LVWSGEDAIDDTLLPGILAAGGDPANVAFISGVMEDGAKRTFDPSRDIEALAKTCALLGNVNLIVIDPIAVIAKGDSHKNAETRRDLQPLADLAEKTQAAVLGIHHLTKRSEGADPVDRVSGSLAFGAAPRVVMLSALDPKHAEPHGVLVRAKSNNGPSRGGFEFASEIRPLDNYPDIAAQRILWGGYINESARDVLARFEPKQVGQQARKAVLFLTDALANGPKLAAEVIADAAKQGIAERTLRYVYRTTIGGVAERHGKGKEHFIVWELPKATMQ